MGRLSGARVAVTRPKGRSSELIDAIRREGAVVIEVPLIETVGPTDGGRALREAVTTMPHGTWLVLTAATAVGPLLDVATNQELSGRCKVAALGPGTASALEEAGLPVDLVGEGGGARGLVRPLVGAVDPGALVVLAQAEVPAAGLAEALRAAGLEVSEVAAYATVERAVSAEERAELQAADLVVLASPSAARSLASALGDTSVSPPEIVAFGESTALGARAAGFSSVTVAERPDRSGVLEALVGSWSPRSGDA